MDFSLRNISLWKIIVGLFGVFLILVLINFFVLNSYINDLEDKALQVDIAGKTRSLSQQILSHMDSYENTVSWENELLSYADEHSEILEVFDNGGRLPGTGTYIGPLKGNARYDLIHAKTLWDSIRSNMTILMEAPAEIDTTVTETVMVPSGDSLNTMVPQQELRAIQVANPVLAQSQNFINRNLSELYDRDDQFINALVKVYQAGKKELFYVLLGAMLLNIASIGFGLYCARKYIIQPLFNLNEVTWKISHGNLKARSSYIAQNEIGEIANGVNHLANNLERSRKFIEKIEEGELDQEFDNLDRDKINKNSIEAALLKMRDQMKHVQQEEFVRKWQNEGLARFVDILRASNQNVEELGFNIISSLVDYTKSNQGGLYLLNDENAENPVLELTALYAFDTKRFDQRTIRLGEGLIGQTFLERKTTYLLEIPHEYITITSGLGGANPKAILIVPLQVNNEIFGIIELASFNEFKGHEIELVEKLGENIASTIASVKNNEKTKMLLDESQQLTEQMQAQEEEMRQNMEELSATQEEMARKEMEISGKITAIDNTIGTAEFNNGGEITSVNHVLATFLNYTPDDLRGMGQNQLLANRGIWQRAISGSSFNGEFALIQKDNKEVTLTGSLTPIKNDGGEVFKVILLVTQFHKKDIKDETTDIHLSEIEAQLKLQLEELEITQEQLDDKLKKAGYELNVITQSVNIISIDNTGHIKSISAAASKGLGYAEQDIIGSPVSLIMNTTFDQLKNTSLKDSGVDIIKKDGTILAKEIKVDISEEGYVYLIWM